MVPQYVEALSHIGWVIQSFSFERYTMQGKVCHNEILKNMNTTQDALSGTGYNVYILICFDVQAALAICTCIVQ